MALLNSLPVLLNGILLVHNQSTNLQDSPRCSFFGAFNAFNNE